MFMVAANAYCVSKGKRLPTIDEWEFAGLASATQKDGSAEPGYNRTILDWYADGGRNGLHDIGKNKPNYWGVYDMHGLIWEWTGRLQQQPTLCRLVQHTNVL